ncbi:MAG: cytochrome b N-terminal domain-containing protein [Syntrophobacteraceae bacterium]
MRIGAFLEHIHPAKLSEQRTRIAATFCMGGASFFLFIVLGFTGLLLAVYYLPTAEGARAGIHDLDHVIPFGKLVRSVHYWGGQLMVVTVLLHTIRVVAAGAYMPPRHMNWLIGTALFLLTAGLDFSGYVLRWDAQTFWAAQVLSNLLGEVPLLGSGLQQLFLGGPEISEVGLLRFYVLHCLIGPSLALALIMYHFWRVRRDGKLGQPL